MQQSNNLITIKTQKSAFRRFIKFSDWHLKCGGKPMTPEEIEKVYPKFLELING